MFRSKQTVIRSPSHKLYNKPYCSANCITAYFKVLVTFVFVFVELQRFVQANSLAACSLLPGTSNCRITVVRPPVSAARLSQVCLYTRRKLPCVNH